MKKIESFQVDHMKLKPGIYVSRQDKVGDEVVTTFDIRMKRPNFQPVVNTAELHTIEHIGATFLRNHPIYGEKTIYFGPMGCRTGIYLILKGNLDSPDVVELVKEMFLYISTFQGEIPGGDPVSCGNFYDMNLPMANYEAKEFYETVLSCLTPECLVYP